MPLATEPSRARQAPRAKRGPAILAALMRGDSLDEIATAERLSPFKVESALRDELQRLWAPRAEDYARFQTAWLHRAAGRLVRKTEDGDLRAVDRLLRLSDRLDRYRGFSKATPAIAEDYATIHERLMAKMNRALAHAPAPEPAPAGEAP
jgi:hypothetical protein